MSAVEYLVKKKGSNSIITVHYIIPHYQYFDKVSGNVVKALVNARFDDLD